MLASERHRYILEQIRRDGQVLVSELTSQLGVSDETIRRDIQTLSQKKLLTRVHGGAVALHPIISDGAYRQRIIEHHSNKVRLGQYAASMLTDNQIVLFGTGTTIDAIAESIHHLHNMTFLTPSVSCMNHLIRKKQLQEWDGTLIFLGGIIDCENYAAVGSLVSTMLSRFTADIAFISPTAVNAHGYYVSDIHDMEFCQELPSRVNRIIVVTESRKLDKTSFSLALELEALHQILTDGEEHISKNLYDSLQRAGVVYTEV